MSDIKATSKTVEQLQQVIQGMDASVQGAERTVHALLASIKLMLLQPDSGSLRENMLALCESIESAVFDVANIVNSEAEQAGANYIDENERLVSRQMYDVARLPRPNGVDGPAVPH